MLSTLTSGGCAGALAPSDLLHAGILSIAFCVSTSDFNSMDLMTLVVESSENKSGVTVTLPSLMSSVLPTVMPSTVTCGNGSVPNLMLFIVTGSLSLAEASFSMRGM